MRSPNFRFVSAIPVFAILILAILIFSSNSCFAQLARSNATDTVKTNLRAQTAAPTPPENRPRIQRPLLAPIDQSTQAPLVSNVRAGFVVELWVGNTRIASSAPVPSGATQTRVRLPHRLSPGESVRAREKNGHVASPFSDPVIVENNYVTNRYDNERSGWNPHESELTVRKVRRGFGKICEHPVDDAIRAQPLYVQDVEITGNGKHNVVFVVTDGDEVWAFDADSCKPNDQGLWGGPRKLLGAGESIPVGECGGPRGIWATPVIDRTTNTLYVVAAVQDSSSQFFRLHAINIADGQDLGTQKLDDRTVQFTLGGTTAKFNALDQNNRPGLLWDRGVLYLAFGSSCDIGVYHGWVVAYDADNPKSPTFLDQLGVFNTSPTVNAGCFQDVTPPCMAGVWQSGLGLSADGDGTIYFMTGNGQFAVSNGSYGNTILRLKLPSAGNEMQIVNYFTPFDFDPTYNARDQDLGAGGPVLFSDGSRRFLLAGGKPHKSYLIDRDCHPTPTASCSGDPNWCLPTGGPVCTSDNPHLVLQTLTTMQGMVAGPAYYRRPSGLRIFYGPNSSPMFAYEFQANPPQIVNPPDSTPDRAPITSPIPTVSSHGNAYGSPILWAVFHPPTGQDLTLHAYDAEDLQDNLFTQQGSSLDVGGWVPLGNHYGNSFQVPTVIHGKVFAGSKDRLVVFGLKKRPHCAASVECNDSVAFRCTKDSDGDEFQMQKKQDGEWKAVTGPGSAKVSAEFAYLWDYPTGDTATYRVCSKDQPESCAQEFTAALPHQACAVRGEKEAEPQCGRKGKPPCSLTQPWPVSSRGKN